MKVNTKTLIATRESLPMALIGLSAETLRNLQTELNPVPEEFKDIEFWDEVDATPTFDHTTHMLDGTEVLTVNATNKTVSVVRGVRAKTVAELAAERKALVPVQVTKLQAMKAMKQAGIWATFQTALTANVDAPDEWNLALDLRRDNAFVALLAPALGLTEVQLDDLFILASTL